MFDVAINRAGINLKNNSETLLFRSFYWASLTFVYLWYSSSISYAANDNSDKENTICGYSHLFAWNCRLY